MSRRRLTLLTAEEANHSGPSDKLPADTPQGMVEEDRYIVSFLVPNEVPGVVPSDLNNWKKVTPTLTQEDLQQQRGHFTRWISTLASVYEEYWCALLGIESNHPPEILPDSENVIDYNIFLKHLHEYITLCSDESALKKPKFGKKEWRAFLKLIGAIEVICQSILSQLRPELERPGPENPESKRSEPEECSPSSALRFTIQKYHECLSDELAGRLRGFDDDLQFARHQAYPVARESHRAILDLYLNLGRRYKVPSLGSAVPKNRAGLRGSPSEENPLKRFLLGKNPAQKTPPEGSLPGEDSSGRSPADVEASYIDFPSPKWRLPPIVDALSNN